MRVIKLPSGIFEFDPNRPIGKRGGFGQVFLGISPDGREIAVKKLHRSVEDAAHRELRIGDDLKGRSFEYIVPFIDTGEDADTGEYFVVMPKAEKSLQETINTKGPLAPIDAVTVLIQITTGLMEVGDLVHRDLKPDNILFHEGKWKIADFGIARYLQDPTSENTLKDCLSPLYAAPEQWRFERATHATDFYSLGCIAYYLLTGKPPFTQNPQVEHQNAPVPLFNCNESRLIQLINMCLRKVPGSRPSLSRCHDLLNEIIAKPRLTSSMSSLDLLSTVAAHVSSIEQEAQAREAAEKVIIKDRAALAKSAYEILSDNIERLWGKIHSSAANAIRKSSSGFDFRIGNGQLIVDFRGQNPLDSKQFHISGWDVVAFSTIMIIQQNPRYRWSASLWYKKVDKAIDYRWYEASYWTMRDREDEPYAEDPGIDADRVAARVTSLNKFAFGPIAIDDEKENDFHERWIWLLSKAATGHLRKPSNMPFGWPPY